MRLPIAKDMHAECHYPTNRTQRRRWRLGWDWNDAEPNDDDGKRSRNPARDTTGSISRHQVEAAGAGPELRITSPLQLWKTN
jgi:hypothetical protein